MVETACRLRCLRPIGIASRPGTALERGTSGLRSELGHFSAIVGGTVEKDAASLIDTVLTRSGWQMVGEPEPTEVNGEIDVAARALGPDGAEV
ncbi:MAG: hypothetical protein ACYDH5_20525 [Acidimicrobiales bacterium]